MNPRSSPTSRVRPARVPVRAQPPTQAGLTTGAKSKNDEALCWLGGVVFGQREVSDCGRVRAQQRDICGSVHRKQTMDDEVGTWSYTSGSKRIQPPCCATL